MARVAKGEYYPRAAAAAAGTGMGSRVAKWEADAKALSAAGAQYKLWRDQQTPEDKFVTREKKRHRAQASLVVTRAKCGTEEDSGSLVGGDNAVKKHCRRSLEPSYVGTDHSRDGNSALERQPRKDASDFNTDHSIMSKSYRKADADDQCNSATLLSAASRPKKRVDAASVSKCFKSKAVVHPTPAAAPASKQPWPSQSLNGLHGSVSPISRLEERKANQLFKPNAFKEQPKDGNSSMKDLIAAAQAKRRSRAYDASVIEQLNMASNEEEETVARDTFEGMLETLCRTKESIGRTTRQAMECAHYVGLADKLVDRILLKLRNEADSSRRIDLFFLVDSITQCSFSHTGLVRNVYLSAVERALPDLLNAAAPPGDVNRHQCLKVLKLWLQRNILPSHVLSHFIRQLQFDDNEYTAALAVQLQHSQRSYDDPLLREMEGLVDEYGSNALLQINEDGDSKSCCSDGDEE